MMLSGGLSEPLPISVSRIGSRPNTKIGPDHQNRLQPVAFASPAATKGRSGMTNPSSQAYRLASRQAIVWPAVWGEFGCAVSTSSSSASSSLFIENLTYVSSLYVSLCTAPGELCDNPGLPFRSNAAEIKADFKE